MAERQRKAIAFIATSLDGFIAEKDGSVEWLFTDMNYGYSEFYSSVGTIVMGRKTFDQIATFGGQYPYAGKETVVFSRNPGTFLRKNPRGVRFSADVIGTVRRLLMKKKSKGNIWIVGGADILSILLKAGLVDRIIVSIHPIILGQGIPLLRTGKLLGGIGLKLTRLKKYDNGLVQLGYDVQRKRA